MAFNRFNRYRRRPRPIKPIRGNPYDNIPKWLYEKTKKSRDPIEGKTRKTKEKKINIPNLQKTLTMLKNKTNEMIQWITRIPIIERRMIELEEQYKRDIAAVRSAMAFRNHSHGAGQGSSSSSGTNNPGFRRGGRFTKPIPSTNRRVGGTTNKGQTIKVGDVVKDMNSTWPKYQCEGMVISINGNNITWVDNKTGDTLTDNISDLMKIN